MPGFSRVKPTREMQANDALRASSLANAQASVVGRPDVGDVSPNFYDDPTVNALAKLPSQQDAERYTGASPSFYGVQRPGDWQRVVQREMAADRLPGGQEQLGKLIEGRVMRARRGGIYQ